jgi:protein O-mannosyl-transferase
LLIHYQLPYLTTLSESYVYVIPVLFLCLGILYLLVRNSPFGYLGAWIVAILAPTTAVPILLETAAERRMYLPLLALVAAVVVGVYVLNQRWLFHIIRAKEILTIRGCHKLLMATAVLVALGLGLLSAIRTSEYRDEKTLWTQVLQQHPDDFLAHGNLGSVLKNVGRIDEAIVEFRASVALRPDYSDAVTNLAAALTDAGQPNEAIAVLQPYLSKKPDDAMALNDLGTALAKLGRFSEASKQFQRAIQLDPKSAEAHNNMGILLVRDHKLDEAAEEFRTALELNANYVDAHENFGKLLLALGNAEEATTHLEVAAQLAPNRSDIQKSLGDALRTAGRLPAAIQHYQTAVRLSPEISPAYSSLAKSLALANRSAEAIQTAEKAAVIARSSHNDEMAREIENWLTNYKAALKQPVHSVPESNSPAPK